MKIIIQKKRISRHHVVIFQVFFSNGHFCSSGVLSQDPMNISKTQKNLIEKSSLNLSTPFSAPGGLSQFLTMSAYVRKKYQKKRPHLNEENSVKDK